METLSGGMPIREQITRDKCSYQQILSLLIQKFATEDRQAERVQRGHKNFTLNSITSMKRCKVFQIQ